MSDSHHPFSDLLNFLGETQIFQGLPREQLAALVQLARAQAYDKGDMIFHQGEEGSGFFIVQSGRIKVFQLSASGREQILHVFGAGEHFAEVPALDGQCFPASAAALEKTELLFFPRQLFLELLERNPTLAINLLKSFARHLRRFSNLVDNLSLREVPGRLAAYLLTLCDQGNTNNQIELPLNKGQLAAMLGTIPETLSRVFHKLSRDGIIKIDGTKITVLDRESLHRMAQ